MMENRFQKNQEVELTVISFYGRYTELARRLEAKKWRYQIRGLQYKSRLKLHKNRIGIVRNYSTHFEHPDVMVYLVFFPALDREFLVREEKLKEVNDFQSAMRKILRDNGAKI